MQHLKISVGNQMLSMRIEDARLALAFHDAIPMFGIKQREKTTRETRKTKDRLTQLALSKCGSASDHNNQTLFSLFSPSTSSRNIHA
jgi:hypothetical protein